MQVSVVQKVQELMLHDDDDQSERLQDTDERATPEQKQVVDEIFICLCGYSLATILAGDA
jgi:hypothetical protein